MRKGLSVYVPYDVVKAVDKFRKKQAVPPDRSKAFRFLIKKGLEVVA